MASQQTEHYGLNQWAGKDDFLRTEFNEDNQKIDGAIKGIVDGCATDLADMASQMAARIDALDVAKSGAVVGVCTGGALDGEGYLHVTLGFCPTAVVAATYGGTNAGQPHTGYAQIALPGFASENVEVLETGFRVKGALIGYPGHPCGYVVFR